MWVFGSERGSCTSADDDRARDPPVGPAGVEQRSDPVVLEVAESEADACNALDQVVEPLGGPLLGLAGSVEVTQTRAVRSIDEYVRGISSPHVEGEDDLYVVVEVGDAALCSDAGPRGVTGSAATCPDASWLGGRRRCPATEPPSIHSRHLGLSRPCRR
jgi:hypothetical protein